MDLYAPYLLRFAKVKVGDASVCEDIVQEAFIVLFQKFDQVQPEKVKAFLFQVVYNKIKDYYKLKKNNVEVEPYHAQVSDGRVAAEAKDIVNIAMAQLPQTDRDLIVLRDLEGYDYKEIAQITGLSDNQVKVYLFRARKKMKSLLEKMEVRYGGN